VTENRQKEDISFLNSANEKAIKEAVYKVLYENGHRSPFPLYITQAVANTFNVTVHCVRKWVQQGKLHPHCHRISGRAVRFLFTTPDLERFFAENFPSSADLGNKQNDPRISFTRVRVRPGVRSLSLGQNRVKYDK